MTEVDELTLLKERAGKLGLKVSNNIGLDTLREKVNAAASPKVEVAEPTDPARAKRLALAKERKKAKQSAEKLIRIRLTCMNPAKKEFPGEIITVSNKVVGTQRKFIPFNMSDDGYHVPQMILNALQARKFQQFYTERLPNGDTHRKGRLQKEFAIEILPQLTKKDIDELAKAQAQAGGV